jgi:hypothetical protein
MKTHALEEGATSAHGPIPLAGPRGRGKHTIIDIEDVEQVKQYSWHLEQLGHARRSVTWNGRRTTQQLHHFSISCPLDFRIDHVNGDRLDNRRCNLRLIPKKECQSKPVPRYQGVFFRKSKAHINPLWGHELSTSGRHSSLVTTRPRKRPPEHTTPRRKNSREWQRSSISLLNSAMGNSHRCQCAPMQGHKERRHEFACQHYVLKRTSSG